MTLDYLKDLIFDCLNEDRGLNLKDLYWDSISKTFTLMTQDGDHYLLSLEKADKQS